MREITPATLKISEKAMKYHFLLRKSIFGLRKNSTLNNPSVVRPWSCVVRLEPSPAVSSLFRLGTGQTARDVRRSLNTQRFADMLAAQHPIKNQSRHENCRKQICNQPDH